MDRADASSVTNAGQRNERTPPATLPLDSEMQRQQAGHSGRRGDAWVDGSESEETNDDAHPQKKLSKSDRKRLRKQRRQCA